MDLVVTARSLAQGLFDPLFQVVVLGVGEARQVQGILFTRGKERGVVTPFMMSLRCESWDFMRASTLAPVLATLC